MRTVVKKSLLALVVSGLVISPAVNATNGYFSHGYSTKEKGLAGAGTAYSQDAMAAATNPAGMAFVGERMDIGAAIFSPSTRGYTVTGAPPAPVGLDVVGGTGCQAPFGATPGICQPPFSVNAGSVDSENDIFIIPHFARNWQTGADSAVGLSIYGNGGMNTEYTTGSATLPDGTSPTLAIASLDGTFGAGDAGVNLEQLFFNVSFAKKLNNTDAIGASVIIAAQRFAAKGLDNFGQFSLDPANLSTNQHSTSYGAGLKLGYQGEVSDGVRVGVSYQSKISMGEFDEYAGLFAEGGDFDIPSTYSIGISVDVGETGKVIADVQRINYSDVAAISNPVSNLTDGSCLDALNNFLSFGAAGATGAGCLGGADGAGFGWKDVTILKLGYQWGGADATYRVGYSYTGEVIPESQTLFNVLAPAVIEHHVTAGLTLRMGGNQELNVAGMIAPSSSVKGDNPFDGGATQIEIEMTQWEIQAGWAWKY